jgi:signal transduction histidine kinase
MRLFRPPGSLLLILFCVTLVAVSALGWFGWKLLDQERAVEAQHARERLEQAADGIAANVREALAEAPPAGGQPEEGVLVTITGSSISAAPAARLLFRPTPAPEPEMWADIFADGEVLEFQQSDLTRALDWYRRAADSHNPAIHAGALLRMARVLRKLRRIDDAAATYTLLSRSSMIPLAGVPAELVARHALCELFERKEDALALKRELAEARWSLTRPQFAFYWSEASRMAHDTSPPPLEAAALSEALARGWTDLMHDERPRGQKAIWLDNAADDRPILLIWRSGPGGKSVLAARPESIFRKVLSGEGFACAVVDGDGRVVAGRRDGARATVRTMAETQLPWTLYVTGSPGPAEAGMLARQRFLVLITAVMSLFVIGGAYFIARAIRKDQEISRMQSDFVSAVSHEFRSPLTSIRQLSEMLALGRVPNEGRRHVYYETLVREATRLERLVEGLLNLGRMESASGPYRFNEVEVAALASGVAAEFEPRIAGQGRRIECEGVERGCRINADPDALSAALRNLVDNALKYSPDSPAIWVAWSMNESRVAIRVRDAGLGIPRGEQRAIFRKFIRGSAAAQANVRGSGVGLALVRHIVEAHGGDITLASEPGRGSTFTMLLPAART